MAQHGRRHHSGKRSTTNARRSLSFECLERRSLLSANPFYPAVPRSDVGPPALVGDVHPGRADHADAGQGAGSAGVVTLGSQESIEFLLSAGSNEVTLTVSLSVGDAADLLLFVTESPNVSHAPAHGPIPTGNTTSNPPPADVTKAPQSDPGGGYEVDTPAPHVSSLPVETAARTADPTSTQPGKDDILALEDTASATTPAGNESAPGTGSVSAENNLSAAANSIQYLGNPVDGVADASAARSAEGGFLALDEGTLTVAQLAANGNDPSRADLGNIGNGSLTIDIASGSHKVSEQVAGNGVSSGKSLVADAYAPGRAHAIAQLSLDATEGGAIDLTDAAQAGAASESADAIDGKAAPANTDIGSESGVAVFCDMEVAVGAPTSDELPAFAVPIGRTRLPAAAQDQPVGKDIKPAQESAQRIDPRQRASTGLSDTSSLIAGAAMLVLSRGVELEPAEREPKRRFPGVKR